MRQCGDIEAFLEEFKDILERVARSGLVQDPPQAGAVECIVAEIEEVGWERVIDLAESFESIQLAAHDTARRPHTLQVEFPPNYPEAAPRCRSALPRAFTPQWKAGFALKDIVRQFEAALEQYQDVWDVLDDLDIHTWVLEPERPTRDMAMRRIAIGKHCSMQLDLDPAHPRAVPEVRILGADSVSSLLSSSHESCNSSEPPTRSASPRGCCSCTLANRCALTKHRKGSSRSKEEDEERVVC
jgi:E3 ubiquitin-protein ligase FANCL